MWIAHPSFVQYFAHQGAGAGGHNSLMLDKLPLDLLAELASWLGEQPHSFHRVCRSTWRVANDDRALLLWLLRTANAGGSSSPGALFLLVSVHCVARWEEARVLRAVQQLLDAGCTLSDGAQLGCLLTHVSKRGFAAVLASLLERAADSGTSGTRSGFSQQLCLWVNNLLKLSAAQGHEACVRVLLAQGADPNLDGGRPLKAACEAGSAGAVQALLEAGADIHAGGDCALRLCAAAGSPQHCAVMDLLLSRGADVHAKHDEALSLAVERSNVEAVALLLRHGACATARQVLETAAATGCARVVRLLLHAGAQPDADGGRPLRAAAQAGAVEVVHQLLDAGARVRRPSRRSLGTRPPPTSATAAFLEGVDNRGRAWDRGFSSQPYMPASLPGTGYAVGSWPAARTGIASTSVKTGSFTYSWNSQGASGSVPGQVMGGHDSADVLRWEQLCHRESGGRGKQQPRGSSSGSIDESHLYEGLDEEAAAQVGELGDEDGDEGDDGEDEECSGALCAALCAGEGEVVRVLLERGATLSQAVLRCWRQWHLFPGIVAVLQRHSPFSPTSDQAGTRHLRKGPDMLHAACMGCNAVIGSEAPPSAGVHHPDTPGPANTQSGLPLGQGLRPRQRLAPCSAHPYVVNLFIQQLEKELVAACSEGAEPAVRLFLHWGAPVQVCWPCGSQQAQQVEAQPGPCASIPPHHQGAAGRDDVQVTTDSASPASNVLAPCLHTSKAGSIPELGVFREATLTRALHAAVSANHVAVVREVLQHRPSPQWRAATLQPVVLHTAVSEGHIEVVRVLLAAGAGSVTLHTPVVPPTPGPGAAPPGRTPAPASTGWAAVFSLMTQPQPLHKDAGGAAPLHASPPPPLQSESWGAAVLCAAAGCKRCSKVAAAMVALLLEHGFGRCARDALRLVATGRVPAWRDEVAAVVLQAAFS